MYYEPPFLKPVYLLYLVENTTLVLYDRKQKGVVFSDHTQWKQRREITHKTFPRGAMG